MVSPEQYTPSADELKKATDSMTDRQKWASGLREGNIELDEQNAKSFEKINQELSNAIASIESAEKNLMLMPIADKGNPYPGVESWSSIMDKFSMAKKMLQEEKGIFEKGFQKGL